MRVIPGFAFVLAAATAALALAVPAPGAAQSCQRTVSVSPQASAGEGSATLTFAVYSGGCAAAGEVGYEASAGTATPGSDFQLPRGTLRWAAGDTSMRTVTAAVLPDSHREAEIEDFLVRLGDASPSVRITRPLAQGRVLDDDGPTGSVVVDDGVCPQPSLVQYCFCGLVESMPIEPHCVDFRLSAALPAPSTLHWSTVDGTAKAGVDFVPVVQREQAVAAGKTSGALSVQLITRPADTPPRYFYVRISAVSAGAVVDAVATVTIGGS
ncbi:Calx-beta domain-containing protein [Catellatospora sp. KI3]|uniref:Calx-beta domain-containing protein n=1 Tax=Catellatospora sp. KI3 TaxID=3041620 RepID=UPI0024828825|nr:Calx-beta domain-containing protein [Catellatospora sp. KI3]MDI1460897.1 Calx-beta domain-containing protein [Catellatospora sp. KI3]